MTRIEWPKYKGEKMIYTADILLRHHPSLRYLTLKRLRPWKSERWSHLEDLKLVKLGIYEVMNEDNVKMLVREWLIPSIAPSGLRRSVGRIQSRQLTDEAVEFELRETTSISDSRALVPSRGF